MPFTLFANDKQKDYKVVFPKEWKPYCFVDRDGKLAGYAIELFEKVAEKTDIKSKDDLKDKSVAVALKNICEKLITKDITESTITYKGFYSALEAYLSRDN